MKLTLAESENGKFRMILVILLISSLMCKSTRVTMVVVHMNFGELSSTSLLLQTLRVSTDQLTVGIVGMKAMDLW